MSKSNKAASEIGFSAPTESLTGIAEPWVRATRTSFQVTSAWGEGAVRFASRRLNRNREAAERLVKCSTWQDLLELQMNWTKEIVQDYLDEGRELIGIVSRTTNGEVEPGEASDRPAEPPQARRLIRAGGFQADGS
jgi:hypothetical protein